MTDTASSVIPESAWRKVRWPGGESTAMTVGVALEAWERQSQVALVARPGAVDKFSLSYGEYGVRTGVWRLVELFEELDVKATFSVSGLIAQRHPEVLAALAAGGHDLVAHGWVNDKFMPDATPQDERDNVRRTIDAIERASGVRSTGWASPGSSGSEHTNEILLDEGVTWTGDDASDDVPFVQDVGARKLALLPKVNVVANDYIHWVAPRAAPSVFGENAIAMFDTLYAEGERGRPKWADIVLHCHMAGRPAFIPTLRRVLEHVKRHERVWWTRKSDLAAWTLEQDFRR
ncbi:polysaccharide deacetylase family protein [Conexibacter stalactiti]|uniref:Polysaccharide deacetylase family protein n=1 Tax=Conexibacter stalactiti TaxID=1940611 RepID=A0ABU4HJF4_9ACTN|nr:polysaccharide deacetylase family protein [Conexibacter stalactiti]MDW5593446.1 polysaccharide deacetylase family protein [Conexibacter stalactiti]MEC5034087.1 polysaccharide deacetylase family protein [Conexibacter stalactiti]